MALFGKKVKDGAPDAGADAGSALSADDGGAVAVETLEPPTGKIAKAARAPKTPKAKTLKNGTAVGLNIGNQFIKAVEVTSRNGELVVTAMGAVPTPAESYTNGNVLSVSALSGAIKDLWRGAGIKSRVAVTSVAGTGALVVRVIEVPRMSDGELGDNMKVDADRYIPFPPSEVVMDFKALRELPTDPDAPNMEVLLAAAQREIIDLHVQVVQKAKLDPRAIDVEPIAAARALQLERRGDGHNFIDYNEITAIVNLGATGTEISILRGDILVFTRVVPGGGNLITQAIAEGLGLPFADAERVKIESADAQAPAGYGGGNAYSGGGDDFNFGGEEFGGGDLDSAFDDISANPATASDDPFDLDFFNQGPKDEPGAGHAQKESEPEGETPAFNFSGFDFDTPVTPPTSQPAPSQNPPADASAAPMGFSFGFDEVEDESSTSILPVATGSASPTPSEKRTAPLENISPAEVTSLGAMPPSATPTSHSGILGSDTSSLSAFDFDNFDLPAAAPTESPVIATPVEPALPTQATPVASLNFAPTSLAPSSAGEQTPASFDFENDDLASKSLPAQAVPETQVGATTPAEPALLEPMSFDFAPSVASVQATPSATVEEELSPPTPEVAAPPLPAVDEFDLDAIFGTSAPSATPVVASEASSAINIGQEPLSPTKAADEGASETPFLSTSGVAVPASAGTENDDFDLGSLSGGTGNDFAAGFSPTDDFSSFGAGLGASGGNDAAALYGMIYPSLEELAGEVRRSLEFHLGRYPDATISRLVLLGGGARLRNLDVFLTQMVGVPTSVANPFAHISTQTPKLAPTYASENGPLCAIALGLALRDFVD